MRWHFGHSAGRTAGFTLVELMVVLAIVALAVVVSAGAFRGPAVTGLRPVAVQLAAELKAARTAAIVRGQAVTFVLDPGARTYGFDGARAVALPALVGLTLASEDERMRRAGRHSIVFFPDGSSTGGQLTLSVQGQLQQLRVDWVTGAVVMPRRG